MALRMQATSARRWQCGKITKISMQFMALFTCLTMLSVLMSLWSRQLKQTSANFNAVSMHYIRVTTTAEPTAMEMCDFKSLNNISLKQLSTTDNPFREGLDSNKPYEVIMRERMAHIHNFCSHNRHRILKNYPNLEILRQMLLSYVWMISPLHELFYCATPKCGSTTWKTNILQDRNIWWKGDIHEIAGSVLGSQKKAKGKTMVNFLKTYQANNRLAMVRNPWVRLLSAYQDKIVNTGWSLKKLCYSADEFAGKAVTFKVFLQCLAASHRKLVWEPHVEPVTSLCGFCLMRYNLIVKLEELAEAKPFIVRKLNIRSSVKSMQILNKGSYRSNYSEYYKELPMGLISSLRNIYSDDISMFGYPSSPFQ